MILITGGLGQVGVELYETLKITYGSEAVLLSDIRNPDSFVERFVLCDVTNYQALEEIVQKHKITQIYHLAAVLSAKGEEDPGFAWRINMQSLMNVLEVARKNGVTKIYWPSSIAVFGTNSPSHNAPQECPMNPLTMYGVSKLAGEKLCEYYQQKYGLDIRSLRYPGLISYESPAGGGTTDYAVNIFHRIAQNKVFKCPIAPNNAMPMMYMEDAIKATIQLMKADKQKLTSLSYNLNSFSVTPQEFVDAIRKHRLSVEVVYEESPLNQTASSWPDTVDDSLARKEWGWKPSYDLSMTIKAMLQGMGIQEKTKEHEPIAVRRRVAQA